MRALKQLLALTFGVGLSISTDVQQPGPDDTDDAFFVFLVDKLHTMYVEHTIPEVIMLDVLFRLKNEVTSSEAWEDLEYVHDMIPASVEEVKRIHNRDKSNPEAFLNEQNMDCERGKNGKCIDHLTPGKSTIRHAGRGAFATQNIQKGGHIASSSLLHLFDRDELDSNFDDTTSQPEHEHEDPLVNYCFSHDQASAVLLCPTKPLVTLINHSSGVRTNAEIRWHRNMNMDRRSATLEELKRESSAQLAFEIIATEDIVAGDEVFLNYGSAWEMAWKQHLNDRVSHDESSHRALACNNQVTIERIPSTMEQNSNLPQQTQPNYLCLVEPYVQFDESSTLDSGDDVNQQPVYDYYFNESSSIQWDLDMQEILAEHKWWKPCDVSISSFEENQNAYYFTAQIYEPNVIPGDNSYTTIHHVVTDAPIDAIRCTMPSSNEEEESQATNIIEKLNVFQHAIMIPDALFPLHWRNDYRNGSDLANTWNNKSIWVPPTEEAKNAYAKRQREAKCGLYFAPSTIPNSGLGLYTGIDIDAQMEIGSAIPPIGLFDVIWNYEQKDSLNWDAVDYVWDGRIYGAEFEQANVELSSAAGEFLGVEMGMIANYHTGIVNSYMGSNNRINPTIRLDRKIDPGAGGSSDFIGHAYFSDRDIRAGDELFVTYGEQYFGARDIDIPLSAHYREANSIVASAVSLVNGPQSHLLNDAMVKAIVALFKIASVEILTDEVLLSIRTKGDLAHITDARGTAEGTTEPYRSIEWLEENGYCIDRIYMKESTIKQAGNGAFARHSIAEGEVITSSPMLNTWGREMLEMNADRVEHDVTDKQLIYNYHYGHPNSTLLLFPLTRSIGINHKSTAHSSDPCGMGPNAKLRWSPTHKKTQYYLQRHINDLKENEDHATLVMEYVATRDIQPDEEIFIDYGEDWEEAWSNHVKKFDASLKKRKDGKRGFSTKLLQELNADKLNNNQFQTWTEDYFNVCRISNFNDPFPADWDDKRRSYITKSADGKDGKIELTIGDKANEYMNITYDHEGFDLIRPLGSWAPCVIFGVYPDDTGGVIEQEEKEYYFDVGIFLEKNKRYIWRHRKVDLDFVEVMPRPAKSDQNWVDAFRYEIMIPDEMIPPQWKNLVLVGKVP